MSDATILGKKLAGYTARDAVHFALAPVEAAERLVPGQHVGFAEYGNNRLVSSKATLMVGIIDPMLREPVEKGEWCYVMLYQNTVTGLKHRWSHPAFDEMAEAGEPEKKAAEKWLYAYWQRHKFFEPFGQFLDVLQNPSEDQNWVTANGWDMHSPGEMPEFDEFWRNLEVYAGKKFSADHRLHEVVYSCSC